MSTKQYITAQQLLDDAFQLGLQIIESGFRPDFIVGIWRGGTPVGVAVQELLDYCGIKTDHIAIRTSLYAGIEKRKHRVRVHGLNYVVKNINHDGALLIIDDVYDTGRSIQAVIEHLRKACRRNMPSDIRVGTAYFKPKQNRTDRVPDYYVHDTEQWLVFPHELDGLSEIEIRTNKPGLGAVLDRLELSGTNKETA